MHQTWLWCAGLTTLVRSASAGDADSPGEQNGEGRLGARTGRSFDGRLLSCALNTSCCTKSELFSDSDLQPERKPRTQYTSRDSASPDRALYDWLSYRQDHSGNAYSSIPSSCCSSQHLMASATLLHLQLIWKVYEANALNQTADMGNHAERHSWKYSSGCPQQH